MQSCFAVPDTHKNDSLYLRMLLPIGWERAWLLVVLPIFSPPFTLQRRHLSNNHILLSSSPLWTLPGSNHFQHMYISSKEMQSNTTNAWEPMCTFSRNRISLMPSFLTYVKAQKNPGTLYDLSARDERARTISQLEQAIYRRFKLWPTGSCRLWCKMGSWPSLKATRFTHWLTRF